MLLTTTLVALLAAATPEERCPMPTPRNAAELTRGHHGCDSLSFHLWTVANSCFHNGKYVESHACASAVANCERAHAVITADARPYHDNDPYLSDIRGGWLGKSYPVRNQSILGSNDPEFSCTSRTEERLRRMVSERKQIAQRHQDVGNEWLAWYRWAQGVTAECRQQETLRAAEEERKRREEEQRLAEEKRKREEEERARAAAEQQRLEEERQAEAARKREEEEQRKAEAAERERERLERERQARAEAARERHTAAKENIDQMHGDLVTGLTSLEGSAEFAAGLARSGHLRFGLGVGVTPIYADSFMGGRFSSTTDTSGMGLGPYARIDLFPFYGRLFGVGAYLETMMGGAATPTATSYYLHYALGARFFLGPDDVAAFELDFGTGGRTGSWDAYDEFTDLETLGAGSASYGVVGLGGHVCFEARDDKCAFSGYLRVGRETAEGQSEPTNVIRIGLNRRGSYEAFVEWGSDYPRMGDPSSPIAEKTGTHFQVVWSHAWDTFGTW